MNDSNYDVYSRCLLRSVNHIFKKFLGCEDLEEIFETQSDSEDPQVAIGIDGTISGEIIINLPLNTLNLITRKFVKSKDKKVLKKHHCDVAGELANLITGTLANQLQYIDHEVTLSPPEFNDDPISIKAIYDNINISFISSYGGFDVDFYYREDEY